MSILHYRNYPFFSIRLKFILVFMSLISIPFLTTGYFTYSKYSSNVEQNMKHSTFQLVEQISVNLDRYIKELERLTFAPLYDTQVLSILKQHSGSYNKDVYMTIEELQKINLFISSMASERSEIESILIFANDGRIFNNSEIRVRNYWTDESEDWMATVASKEGGLTILPPHDVDYYTSGPMRVISIARLIREPYTHHVLGMIKIDLSSDGFEKIFSRTSFSHGSQLYVYNDTGALMYPDTTTTAPDMNDTKFVSASTISDYTNLQVLGQVPLVELKKEAMGLIRFTIIIMLISLTFAYLLAIILSNRMVNPIRHLHSKMTLVQKGFFKEQAEVTTNDEIGQLTEGFNRMVADIDRLIGEVYVTKIRERDAELAALQSQMNPHFLYNTLESISMMAVQQQQLELSSVVTSLGKLLRYTVDNHQAQVLLSNELQFVEAYLQIQELRCGDMLRTEIYLDPSLSHALVPKLFLQPFVENVIEHGMSTAHPVTIRIRVKLEDDSVWIVLEDDGVGMSTATVNAVKQHMYSVREEAVVTRGEYGSQARGYALRNVHQRIRLLYGEPYGVSIVSTSSGSLFHIRLPFNWGEQKHV